MKDLDDNTIDFLTHMEEDGYWKTFNYDDDEDDDLDNVSKL